MQNQGVGRMLSSGGSRGGCLPHSGPLAAGSLALWLRPSRLASSESVSRPPSPPSSENTSHWMEGPP